MRYIEENDGGELVATVRLWDTEDGRIVPEGHAEARFLRCTPGESIERDAAEHGGLLVEQKRRGRPPKHKARLDHEDK